MTRLHRTPLDKNWQFRQSSPQSPTPTSGIASSFLPVSQFPTVAQIDLLNHKLIPDPYIDTNELDCLWVNHANWIYRTEITREEITGWEVGAGKRVELVFEGLDTIVDIFLNELHILSGNNMHITYRVDITSLLASSLLNSQHSKLLLELRFRNAPGEAKHEMRRIGYKGNGTDVHFGGPERLFLRKAQYHWGWDWGPAINTCGPWKGVFCEVFEGRVKEFVVRQEVGKDLKSAVVRVSGAVEGGGKEVQVQIVNPKGVILKDEILDLDKRGIFKDEISLAGDEIRLWYPWNYGDQPLYTVTCTLPYQDSTTRKIGLRRLQLLQHPLIDAPGTSFVFEINNIRLFLGGSNWIPGHFMLPLLNEDIYKKWILTAKAGNQTMLRVWGGGLVESDSFYSTCDEEGILIWQDFLFACGNYPAEERFLENVREEAEQQVKRVGHHASLAIWAGNNEDYMLAERWGWEYDQSDEDGPWDHTDFPARVVYERLLPDVVQRLGGDVPFVRSSPYGGKTSNDHTVGDTHIWEVWHGQMSPYQSYKEHLSRFISEFGFESAPSLSTLHIAISSPSERHWQSAIFDAHDKGPGHMRRYGMYSGENFRFRFNPLRDFVYCSQFLQAEAIGYAYRTWRREFRGEGKEYCAGVLVWQLNDIWPGTSWAIVDVQGNRKPVWYVIKRSLATVSLGMERRVTKEPHYMLMSYLPEKSAVEIWGTNSALQDLQAELKIRAWDIETGAEVALQGVGIEREITLAANSSTELGSVTIPDAQKTVVISYLYDIQTGDQIARMASWPEPLKYVKFRKGLKVQVEIEKRKEVGQDGEEIVILSAGAPVKGVLVSAEGEGGEAVFEDNFVDLVPREEIRIGVKGLGGREIQVRWLCDWEGEEGFVL
ncbi:hypothetical protein B7494_g7827 [Chlorociboria aeruginascens]|nr:hypothetical protein B7494_g7827 [Chlorociboria aeruginascens]